MTTLQRVIKGCALAFAIALIVGIFGGILSAMGGLTYIFDKDEKHEERVIYDNSSESVVASSAIPSSVPSANSSSSAESKANTAVSSSSIAQNPLGDAFTSLDIDLKAAKLEITLGGSYTVTTDNDNVTVKTKNGILKVTEKGNGIKLGEASTVKIVIPKNTVFDEIDIETGAGKVDIEALAANEIDLELGAGKATIGALYAEREASISTGAGKFTLNGGELNNLDLELGVGETVINGSVHGKSEIDHSVGKLSLNLTDGKESYSFKVKKGVGNIKVDGEKITSNGTFGSGSNRIDIDCGVGEVDIRF